MNSKIILPMEIINKILIIRPSHPIVTILREYANNNLNHHDEGTIFYCKNIYCWLKNNDCFMMEYLNYKYKSYRRVYNKVINSLNHQIHDYDFYKELCVDNQLNHEEYNFKTFGKSKVCQDFWNF